MLFIEFSSIRAILNHGIGKQIELSLGLNLQLDAR